MIVVDVGAMAYDRDESIAPLIDRFHPDVMFAFDPHPDFEEGVDHLDGSVVISRRLAAWTFGGDVPFAVEGIRSGIPACAREGSASHSDPGEKFGRARSFVLAAFLRTLPPPLVLKLDVEGAEYPLLNQISANHVDERLALVLVEWHSEELAHDLYGPRPELQCPVEEWA